MNVSDTCIEVTVATSSGIPKKEELAQNNENDASSCPRATSPEANCPICLGTPENKCFTDSCLHQFCFKCLLEWSKVKAECPLCKQSFKSIIHNVRSIEDYEQYYLSTTSTDGGTLYVAQEFFHREPNYRIRTAATVSSYLDYFVRLEEAITHHVIPPGPSISSGTLWHRRRQRGTSEFRRNIYQQGLWVQRTSDFTNRVRESSPDFYRRNPAQVHRLVPWLNRELNVLLYENSPHIQHVMSRILDLITQTPIRSTRFSSTIGSFIGRHTDHFVHEFYCFATSHYDLVGYDRHANYVGRSEILHHEETSQDSSDSDVQILEEAVNVESPLIQLVDTDSDDCIVLDTPLRTEPEVITLESDEDEVVQINIEICEPQPSTSNQASRSTSVPTNQPKPSTSRRPRLQRNWKSVNNVLGPNYHYPIGVAHSSCSMSPTVSGSSSASWVPTSKRPTKVKKMKEVNTKRKSHKSKLSNSKTKEEVTSNSEDDSSSSPLFRGRKPLVPIMSPSYSEDSGSDRIENANGFNGESPACSPAREQNSPVQQWRSVNSDSERLFVATDSSSSSDISEYKPRLRSVVVKSTVKPEPRVVSPTSESYDYDLVRYSSHRYLDIPSSLRRRIDAYRCVHSHRSRRSSSSSERPYRKRSKKRSKKKSKKDKS